MADDEFRTGEFNVGLTVCQSETKECDETEERELSLAEVLNQYRETLASTVALNKSDNKQPTEGRAE